MFSILIAISSSSLLITVASGVAGPGVGSRNFFTATGGVATWSDNPWVVRDDPVRDDDTACDDASRDDAACDDAACDDVTRGDAAGDVAARDGAACLLLPIGLFRPWGMSREGRPLSPDRDNFFNPSELLSASLRRGVPVAAAARCSRLTYLTHTNSYGTSFWGFS